MSEAQQKPMPEVAPTLEETMRRVVNLKLEVLKNNAEMRETKMFLKESTARLAVMLGENGNTETRPFQIDAWGEYEDFNAYIATVEVPIRQDSGDTKTARKLVLKLRKKRGRPLGRRSSRAKL